MTEERINRFLPIGSVVMLNGALKALMIYGVAQTDNDTGVEYDYIGVLWPEGNIGEDTQFLFNQSDVKEVLFQGYETTERRDFLQGLVEFYSQQHNSENKGAFKNA